MTKKIAAWVEKYGLLYPYGKCQCGCGQDAPIAKLTDSRRGYLRGESIRFIFGHQLRVTETIKERFLASFAQGNPDECWVWQGRKSPRGYGRLNFCSDRHSAHRLSYEFHTGSIPDGMVVCHHCDNPPCVNPAHLFLGTQHDNNADMVAKGRNARGDQQPHAKLNETLVREMFQLKEQGWQLAQLAEKFDISKQHVSDVVNRRRWAHVKLDMAAVDADTAVYIDEAAELVEYREWIADQDYHRSGAW